MRVDDESRIITIRGVSWTGKAFGNKEIQNFFSIVEDGSFPVQGFNTLLNNHNLTKGEPRGGPMIIKETRDGFVWVQAHPILRNGEEVGLVWEYGEK